jgi:hypothetical protein
MVGALCASHLSNVFHVCLLVAVSSQVTGSRWWEHRLNTLPLTGSDGDPMPRAAPARVVPETWP